MKKKASIKSVNLERLVNVLKANKKGNILKRDKATIDLRKLPNSQNKTILAQHSKYFKSEYEKEKALLGWK